MKEMVDFSIVFCHPSRCATFGIDASHVGKSQYDHVLFEYLPNIFRLLIVYEYIIERMTMKFEIS